MLSVMGMMKSAFRMKKKIKMSLKLDILFELLDQAMTKENQSSWK